MSEREVAYGSASPRRPSILLVVLGGVGDAVLSTSMTAMIKRDLPSSFLAVLVWSNGSELILRRVEEIDHVIAYPPAGRRTWSSRLELVWTLRRRRFDVAVAYYSDFDYRVGALAWLAGIPRRIGPYAKRHHVTFTQAIAMQPHRHILEKNLDLLGPLGVAPSLVKPRLPLTSEEIEQGPSMLRQHVPRNRPAVGVSPGSGLLRDGWVYRRWGTSKYAELCRKLVAGTRAFILFCGAEHEAACVDQVIHESGLEAGDYVNLTGRLDLFQYASLARVCDLVVCNDSGALNIASTVDARILAIFGPTDPRHAGPFSTESRTLYVKQPCSPCLDTYRYDSTGCPPQYCMQAISPDLAYQAASTMLGARQRCILYRPR